MPRGWHPGAAAAWAVRQDGGVFLQGKNHQRVVRISVWVAVIGLLLGVLSTVIMATAADAHTALKSSDPKDGAKLTAAPARVVLTFNEPLSASFATVTVTGPGGSVSKGKASVEGGVVTQTLATGIPNGSYAVSFRVVSKDGHPVSDKLGFTVAAATATTATPSSTGSTTSGTPSTAPTTTPAVAAEPSDDQATDSGRTSRVGLAVAVAALALAAGTAVIALTRRRGRE
jgi:methionine-rich copper-binding protein CopC